ncbi:MAG: PAS domain S-box protein [Acidobacteria bacterium]|nr:MAG: PAS domain S-box protein [Acidobacteriota bacterium]
MIALAAASKEGLRPFKRRIVPPAPADAQPAELAHQLRWLIAIRMLVICTVAVTYQFATSGTAGDEVAWLARPARVLLAGGSVLTLVYIALLQFLPQRFVVAQAYVQFLGDLVLVYLFINVLGGPAGGFTILYLVVISVASVLLRRSAGLIVAGLAFVMHSLPLLAAHYPLPAFIQPATPFPSTVQLVYNLMVHLIGFYAIAILTAYLGRDVARAERALAERDADLAHLQALHHDVVQSITSGLITTDVGGIVTSVNLAAEEILGRSRQQLIGRHIADSGLFSREAWAETSEHHLVTKGSGVHNLRLEHDVRRGDETVPVGYSLAILRDGRGAERGFIVIFQDLTELRRLQDQVRMKDRMAAVGAMAAGLAHEVGNPLAAISGSTQMLASSLAASPSQSKLLDIIRRESQRLDRTVKSFLEFARPRPRRPKRFDVAAALAEHVELLEHSPEVKPEHRLVVDLDPPSVEIVADPDQISQVFWNLVRNALKAMPDGGTLTVAGRIWEDRYAIRVQDTGSGMNEEERANLFHPFKSFFDDGTGIGMAIVYRIVDEHGGEIVVDSEPGRGSAITVVLPLEGAATATAPGEAES